MAKKNSEGKYYRINSALLADLAAIKVETGKSEVQLVEEAIKLFRDYHYMQNKATFINNQIIQVMQATCDMMEDKINRKTNSVLCELAIQSGIQNLVLASSLEVKEGDLKNYRLRTLDYLKLNNRPLRLDNE